MKKMSCLRVAVPVVALSLLVGVLFLSGCGPKKQPPVVRLPDTPRLVGGGMMIEWKAPEPGTAYLIERQTGKIIETRSLPAGGVFTFTATSIVQADEFEQMLGIRFSQARFLLYFEPADQGSETALTSEVVRALNRL